ncbi:MAG: FAD-dependent oxidoreductase [Alphaproteobacteria bacterium]|nr:FAD-dependent oxidoreductase [Alphaproteobacteria bacterium]
MTSAPDLAIVGAGPAGLAAAIEGARLGLAVALYDEQPEPGGQIFRAAESVAAGKGAPLAAFGADYAEGPQLVARFRASPAAAGYMPRTTIWLLDRQRTLGHVQDGKARMLRPKRVLIATGAQERPVPLPGWTTPGVMTVGAAQGLMKSAGQVPEPPFALCGSGPLLYQFAAQLVAAGERRFTVLDTTPKGRWARALPFLPGALRDTDLLLKGLGLMQKVRMAGVPVLRHVRDVAVHGNGRVEHVTFRHGNHLGELPVQLLLLHQGVVPNVSLSLSVPLRHVWDAAQRCFRPALDAWGNSDVAGIAVAGDGGGIGGWQAATAQGELAALEAAHALGRIERAERDRQAAPIRARLKTALAARGLIDTLYAPPPLAALADATIVCRCEEVTAGQVRAAIAMGDTNPNAVKSRTRAGMGPCQGRMCGLTVSELVAHARGLPPDAAGTYRLRPPIKPLPVAVLADLDTSAVEEEEDAT